jgi:hypothetical protein
MTGATHDKLLGVLIFFICATISALAVWAVARSNETHAKEACPLVGTAAVRTIDGRTICVAEVAR